MPTCSKCQIDKHLGEFYTDKRIPKGYRSECKECYNARRAKRHRDRVANDPVFRNDRNAKRREQRANDVEHQTKMAARKAARDEARRQKAYEKAEAKMAEIAAAKDWTARDAEYAGVSLSAKKYKMYSTLWRRDDGIIDHVAVERVLEGHRVDLTFREMLATIALGSHRGLSVGDLAERLGVTSRQITRLRVSHGIPTRDESVTWGLGKLPQGSLRITRSAA